MSPSIIPHISYSHKSPQSDCLINTFLCSPPHPPWQQLNTLASLRDSRGFVGAGNYISAGHYPRNVCPDKSEGAAAVAVLVTRWTPSSISKQFPGSSSYLSLSSSSSSSFPVMVSQFSQFIEILVLISWISHPRIFT